VKKPGDKMEAGDRVCVRTWAYTLSTRVVRNAAHLVKPGDSGLPGVIERVVGRNAVVVRFGNGCLAPVHPDAVFPGGV
jgi:hypothetical protein